VKKYRKLFAFSRNESTIHLTAMANWAWPEITDEDSARSAAHIAGGWAAFVAGLTTLLAIVSIVNSGPVMGIRGSALVDAVLFAAVAWRVWAGSRAWAVTGLALYCIEIVFNVVTHPPGIGIFTILVLLGLVNGVRGTFKLHQYEELRKQRMFEERAAAAQAQSFSSFMPSSGTPPPPPPPN
jgi:hypothetical protein